MADGSGQKLTRYKVIRRLGRGGMGEVYLAEDTQEGRQVALKLLTAAGMDEDALRRFKREIQLCSACQHPGIVRIYDFGVSSSQPYYVMEVLDGFSLDRCVHDHEPLEIEQGISVGIQVGEALAYLHGRGMLHRDIKPHNVFLDKSGQAKLVDFGLAWSSSATCITRTGQILGSPRYLSPEMVRGDELGIRADLFQYGLVLYEVLTGQHAFDAESAPAVMEKIVKEPVVPPSKLNPKVSSDLERVIDNLLAKEPGDRYGKAEELVADLRKVQRGESVQRRTPGRRRRRRASGSRGSSATHAMSASAATALMAAREGRVARVRRLLWGGCLLIALFLAAAVGWKHFARARAPEASDMVITPFAGGARLSWHTERAVETWIGIRPTPEGQEAGRIEGLGQGGPPMGLRWTRSVDLDARRDHRLRIADLEGDRDYDLVVGSPDGPLGKAWGFHCPARLRLEGPTIERPDPDRIVLTWSSNVPVTMKARVRWAGGKERRFQPSPEIRLEHRLDIDDAGFDALLEKIELELHDADGGTVRERVQDVGGWAVDLGRRVMEMQKTPAWKDFCRSRGQEGAWDKARRLFENHGVNQRWKVIAEQVRRRMGDARGPERLRLHRWLLPLEEVDEAVRVVCKRDAFGYSESLEPFISLKEWKSVDSEIQRDLKESAHLLNYAMVDDAKLRELPEAWAPVLKNQSDDDGPAIDVRIPIYKAPVSFSLSRPEDALWAYLSVEGRGGMSQLYLSALVNEQLEILFLRQGRLDDRMVARFPASVLRRGENVVTLRLRRPAEGLERTPFVLRSVSLVLR